MFWLHDCSIFENEVIGKQNIQTNKQTNKIKQTNCQSYLIFRMYM